MLRKTICLFVFLIVTATAFAQWDDEYLMEVGGGVGTVCYEGDFNGSIVSNMQPMASLLVRRVFNPYMGLAATLSYGTLKGSSRDENTYYPELQQNPVTFSNMMFDLGVRYEYNCWRDCPGDGCRRAKQMNPTI